MDIKKKLKRLRDHVDVRELVLGIIVIIATLLRRDDTK